MSEHVQRILLAVSLLVLAAILISLVALLIVKTRHQTDNNYEVRFGVFIGMLCPWSGVLLCFIVSRFPNSSHFDIKLKGSIIGSMIDTIICVVIIAIIVFVNDKNLT